MVDKKPEPTKVLVAGDVEGRFEVLFKRVDLVNKKAGPFDILLCVGEFFGPQPEANMKLLSGDIPIPIPTYILGPATSDTVKFYPGADSEELTNNLTFLGAKGMLTTASGLNLAYLSGSEAECSDRCHFDEETVSQLAIPATASMDFRGIDVLMTGEWPKQISKYSSAVKSASGKAPPGSGLISKLATVLKPRYHFAALEGVHYERQPYRNHKVLQEIALHTTRFIGLAKVGNKEKAKFLYAFNIVPMKYLSRPELTEQPPDASEFPFADVLRDIQIANREKDRKNGPQFFYDMNAPQDEEDNRGRGRKRAWMGNDSGSDGPKRPPGPCWFCLSSPEVEKHLVVAVGDHAYMALAKGALTWDHILILPINHIQSMVAAPEELREEIEKFKFTLQMAFKERDKMVVFFERNYRTQHLQIQVIPVPKSRAAKLQSVFDATAESKGIELDKLQEEQEIWDVLNEGCPYFLAELPGGTKLFTRQMKQFPIQFGREVLANHQILNLPDRVDWRAAVASKEEEQENVDEFKKMWSKFDFTNDDD